LVHQHRAIQATTRPSASIRLIAAPWIRRTSALTWPATGTVNMGRFPLSGNSIPSDFRPHGQESAEEIGAYIGDSLAQLCLHLIIKFTAEAHDSQ
jgi:hypothetical protein